MTAPLVRLFLIGCESALQKEYVTETFSIFCEDAKPEYRVLLTALDVSNFCNILQLECAVLIGKTIKAMVLGWREGDRTLGYI